MPRGRGLAALVPTGNPLPSPFTVSTPRYDDLWRAERWRDDVGGKPLGGFLAGIVVLAFGWNLIANLWLPSAAWVVANVALTAVLVVAARRAGLSFEELGLRRDRVGRGLAVGAVAAGIVLVVLAIAIAVPSVRDSFDDSEISRHTAATDAYFTLVRIPLGTVLLEEVLFRGVLLALALRRWSVRTAMLVTAALFGLWHVVPAAETAHGGLLAIVGATFGTVAITTLAGLLLAWMRLRANSILAPVLAHIATNSFAYLAAVVALEVS
jgi:membrane protease YdiL (CAAX protease family)